MTTKVNSTHTSDAGGPPSSRNLVGIHALVFTGEVDPESVRDAARRAAAAGYRLLELSLHDLEGFDLERSAADLAETGLQVAGSRGLAPEADVSSEDPQICARGVDLLRRSVDTVHALGGHLLSGALYSAFGKFPRPLSARGRANAVAALRDLAPYANQRGVTLGLEVCNRYETNVVNTARQALDFADDVGSDDVVIHLDSYHMNIEEEDFIRPVHEVGDRLGYVHIGENQRGYLGSGHIDFPSLFHALADIGYNGPITFESFSTAVVAEQLSSDLAIWRNTWDDGDDLAVHACRFITDAIHAAVPRSTRS